MNLIRTLYQETQGRETTAFSAGIQEAAAAPPVEPSVARAAFWRDNPCVLAAPPSFRTIIGRQHPQTLEGGTGCWKNLEIHHYGK
jgi:hypothetical protein